jgi:small subunit ribosomal protein S6
MLILNPAVEADRQSEIIDRLRATVEQNSGRVVGIDDWGKRKLAYEIAGDSEGLYSVITFTTSPQTVAEVERVLRITDDVVRFMTVRLDSSATQAPSAAQPAAD